ncbi:MAG: hypothetical protein KIT46_00070 [Anaerolineales bacterium]|nr:hypothetical protein [Anaerolineales bacterium]MCW5854416.1 hypothetical protein [Anaerolineales bacterium]
MDDFAKDEELQNFLREIEEASALELTPEPELGFLGMTPGQRFVIALMFFLMVLIIGAFALLITGAISLPL